MNKFLIIMGLVWLNSLGNAFAQAPKAVINVQALNASFPAQYLVQLSVPAEHHAYLDAGAEKMFLPIAFDSNNALAALGLTLTKLEKPAGVYDEAVKATVLRDKGDFTFFLNASQNLTVTSLELGLRYQLCNDVTHVCFRPQTELLHLPLPTFVSPAPASTSSADSSVMDSLLGLFERNQDNSLLLFALMFAAGLLSVATPCVYPMLPITSMFIVNRANGIAKKEKQHALVYLIGIVGTYMTLGLMAGMTGGAFNTFMQSAWVNLAFALFFAFFAIALLGFYELSFMQGEVHSLDQKTSRVKGLAGTWLMGTVAGLVISPCVGPIVFALLLQVADNIAAQAAALAAVKQSLSVWQRLLISGQGSVLMGGFGLGVGLPFFIISVVKFKKLPKAGYWMNKIKTGFGLAILYFAYVYLGKGMGVLGVSSAVTAALAVGLLMVWIGVVNCNILTLLPSDAAPNEKMHRYVGIVALLIGGWLVIGGLAQTPLLPLAKASTQTVLNASCNAVNTQQTNAVEQDAGINWYRQFDAAQQLAKQTGKPIFIDFYANWCANCTAFKAQAASNTALNQALRERAITVKLVDQEPDFEKFRANPAHRPLKIGLPYFAILAPDGQLIWSSTDYTATQKMIQVLTDGAV